MLLRVACTRPQPTHRIFTEDRVPVPIGILWSSRCAPFYIKLVGVTGLEPATN